MDTENKKRITPDIDEEKMMNLMVDGVKIEGLQAPAEKPSSELPEKEKPVKRERSRTKGSARLNMKRYFSMM